MAVSNNFLSEAFLLTSAMGLGNMEWQILGASQAKSKLYATMEEAAPLAKRISDFYRSLGYQKMAHAVQSRGLQGFRVVISDREKFSRGLYLYEKAIARFAQSNNPVSREESLPAEVELLKEQLEKLCLHSWVGENVKLGIKVQEKLPAIFPESLIEIKKTSTPGSYLLEVSSQCTTIIPSLKDPNVLVPVSQQVEEQIVTSEDLAFVMRLINRHLA